MHEFVHAYVRKKVCTSARTQTILHIVHNNLKTMKHKNINSNPEGSFLLSFQSLLQSLLGYEKIAQMLIEKGADVNVIAGNNNSALILAAEHGNI